MRVQFLKAVGPSHEQPLPETFHETPLSATCLNHTSASLFFFST